MFPESRVAAWIVLAALSCQPAHAGDLPPVRRLRIPSEDVTRYFDARTPFRSLSVDELEQRIDAARSALAAESITPARILRAEHRARWMEDGSLDGRTLLTVDLGPKGPAAVAIHPWSLPIPPEPSPSDLRTRPDGTLIAWVTRPGVSQVVIPWRVSIPLVDDVADWSLDLPECLISSLTVDLPSHLALDIGATARSRQLEAEADRRLLRFDGVAGHVHASIRRVDPDRTERPAPWLRATHSFEVTATGSRFEAEWNVRLPSPAPRALDTHWDAGIVPIDVTGPAVEGFEVSPDPHGGARVRIRLAEGIDPETTLHLSGLLNAPSAGPWTIPRVELPGSLRVGERTLLHLSTDWSLLSLVPHAAALVEPPSDIDPDVVREGTWLCFDATGPGAAATLELGDPDQPPRIDLRASLRVESDRAALEAEATWTARGERPSSVSLTLPGEWTCDSAEIVSLDEPTLWSASPVPGVGQLITITPPPSRDANAPLVVRLRASRPLLAVTRLSVPRPIMHPGRVGDEIWSLAADARLAIRPLVEEGIEWLDTGAMPLTPATGSEIEMVPRFVWRWLHERAGLDLDLRRAPSHPRAIARTLVQVIGQTAEIDAYLTLDADDSPPERVEINEAASAGWTWSRLSDGIDRPLRELAARESPPPDHGGEPTRVRSLEWPQERTRGEPLILHAHARLDPNGGPIPSFTLSAPWNFESILLIATDETRTLKLNGPSLVRLDPRSGFESARDILPPHVSSTLESLTNRLAFRSSVASATPRLQIGEREVVSSQGLVTWAELKLRPGPADQVACRLEAEFASSEGASLRVQLPPNALPRVAWLDGSPVIPIEQTGWLAIPTGTSLRNRPSHTFVIEYVDDRPESGTAWSFPRFSAPTLASVVTLFGDSEALAPSGLSVDEIPAPSRRTPPPRLTTASREQPSPPRGTIASWLEELAAIDGLWVIDARALSAADVGPLAHFPVVTNEPDRSVADALASLGLVTRPAGILTLLTSNVAAPESDATHRAFEAARDGRDRSGRYMNIRTWLREVQTDPSTVGLDNSIGRQFPMPSSQNMELTPSSRETSWRPGPLLLAAGLVALGWPHSQGTRRRRLAMAVIVTAIVGLLVFLRPDLENWVAPVSVAASALAAFWLLVPPTDRTRPDSLRGPSSILARTTGVVLLAWAAGQSLTARGFTIQDGRADADSAPILVLLPYDDPTEAAEPPRRALIRLGDLERLDALIRESQHRAEEAQHVREDGFGALSARHVLRKLDDRLILESTTILTGASGGERRDWPVVVEGWLGVTARVDDVEVPITLEPGGVRGHVRIHGAGDHELTIEASRSATANAPLKITSVARAEWNAPERSPTDPGEPIGPRDRLEARSSPEAVASQPGVDLLTLWNAEPLGDALTIQIRNDGPSRLASVTLAIPNRATVLSPEIGHDRRDRVEHEGTDYAASHRVMFQPPLEPSEFATLRAWLPHADAIETPRLLPRPVVTHGATIRSSRVAAQSLPGWALLVNDPLARAPNRQPVTDFLADWARPIPIESRPTIAWDALDPATITFTLRPATPTVHLRPSVECAIDGARVRVRAQIDIINSPATLDSLSVRLPRGFHLYDVVGEGPGDWRWSLIDDLINIRLTSEPRRPDRLAILGWFTTDAAPGSVEGLSRELPLAIPTWIADVVEPSEVSIAAAPEVALDIEETTGWLRSIPSNEPTGPLPIRAAFRVDADAPSTRLRYRLEGRAADVRVLSHLELLPDSVEWRAVARYRVRGGPCREIRFDLPSAFSNGLEVRVEPPGGRVQITTLGATTRLEIQYEKPTWDAPRVWIRSISPLSADAIDFPSLVPLGLGRVDTLLAWSDSSRLAFNAEASDEIRDVEPPRFAIRELDLDARLDRHVYHVQRAGWSFRLRPTLTASDRDDARVSRAEVEAQIGADGVIQGRLLCTLEGTDIAPLRLRVPEAVQILGAHDGTRFLPCYREPNGELSISGRTGRVVALYWREDSLSSSHGTLAFPVPARIGVPIALLIRDVSGSRNVSVDSGTLVPTERPTLLVENIETEAHSLEDDLARVDHSDPIAMAAIARRASDLNSLRAELTLAATSAPGPIPRETLIALADVARTRLSGAFRAANLEVLDQASQTAGYTPESSPPILRTFGVAHWFHGATASETPRVKLHDASGGLQRPAIGHGPRTALACVLSALALLGASSRRSAPRAMTLVAIAAVACLWLFC